MPRIPIVVKARAVKLRREGRTYEMIADRLVDEFGYLTGSNTLSTQVRQWRADPKVQAVL